MSNVYMELNLGFRFAQFQTYTIKSNSVKVNFVVLKKFPVGYSKFIKKIDQVTNLLNLATES